MDTPVLLIGFNRPDLIRQVVEALVSIGATKVYAAIDGPREGNESDRELVGKVKEVVESAPWPGSLRTLFREKNIGCRRGVSEAITWFFDNEEQGIILEDDCVPDPSFFPYVSQLLETYQLDERVGMVSGSTFFPLKADNPESYTFSRYPHIWGWATWRRAWKHYDSNFSDWATPESIASLREAADGSSAFVIFWTRLLDGVATGKIDTWDYVWSYSFWKAGFLSISPSVNLIKNIGFTPQATHTRKKPIGEEFVPESSEIAFPLVHPQKVVANQRLDRLTRVLAMGVNGKRVRSLLRLAWVIRNATTPR